MIPRAEKPPAAALGEFDTKNSSDRGSTPRTSTTTYTVSPGQRGFPRFSYYSEYCFLLRLVLAAVGCVCLSWVG